jgi:hypothetical protein
MKILSTSALSAIAATNFLLLCNFSAVAQSFVYDIRNTYSNSGVQYFEENTEKPVFGTSKGSSSSLFVMGPEEKVTVQTQTWDGETIEKQFGRHSYAVIHLDISRSGGTITKQYFLNEYPVDEGDEGSGANPTLFQLDAAKKNVKLQLAVDNQPVFSYFEGKATLGKPIKTASSPVWYSSSLSATNSGIWTMDEESDSSLQANEPFYGSYYSRKTTAKLNSKLTQMVYTMDYYEALQTLIEDLESKGFVDEYHQIDQ